MRRTLALMCRQLSESGIGVAVPDLPGMGEHPISAAEVSFADMSDCVAGVAEHIFKKRTPTFHGWPARRLSL